MQAIRMIRARLWPCNSLSWLNAMGSASEKYCCFNVFSKIVTWIDRSHVTTAILWPLGVAVVSVTCMRVRWVSHTWKYTQWNIFLFESSDKSPYRTNPYHIEFRYEASLNFHTYFGQCPNDIYILLHIPLSCLSKLPAHGANDRHGP